MTKSKTILVALALAVAGTAGAGDESIRRDNRGSWVSAGVNKSDSKSIIQSRIDPDTFGTLTEPVQIGTAGLKTPFICEKFAVVSNTFSGSGSLKIVTGSSGKKVYLCGYQITATSAAGLNWKEGTGTNCGTGTAAVTGVQQVAAKGQISSAGLSPFGLGFMATATDDLCIASDAASDVMGWISYTLQ